MSFLELLGLSASVGSLQHGLFCPSCLAVGLRWCLCCLLFPLSLDVQRPSSLKQASSTASSAESPIQHSHQSGRPFIHIAVNHSAFVCVIRYLSAFGHLLGCFPVYRSLGFQLLVSFLSPSWFFGLFVQGFPPQGCLLFSSWSVFLSVSSFLSQFCVCARLFPTGVLLFRSSLVFLSVSSFPSRVCAFSHKSYRWRGLQVAGFP